MPYPTLLEHALLLSGQNGLYRVETANGILLCRAASRIRKEGQKLLAGDRVTVEEHQDGTGFIRELEPRKNALTRPPIANIDLLVLVAAGAVPKPDPFLLDKMTVVAEKMHVPIAILLTKTELGETEALTETYRKTPYPILTVSEHGTVGKEPLLNLLRGKTSVFCGASGVGKSTVLNALFPSLHAEVGSLTERIGRGKNTTRTTTLYPVGDNTYLADSPGFTMLELAQYCTVRTEELPTLFAEFLPYLGQCRYTRCTHTCEEGCRILRACRDGDISMQRHESYCRLYQEQKNAQIHLYPRAK